MALRELSPKLQLSFDEYVETWSSLLSEYHMRGLRADLMEQELKLADEEMMQYSMNLAAILLIVGVKTCKTRLRVSEDIRTRVSDAIIEQFFRNLHSKASAEVRGECVRFFEARYKVFNEICTNLASKSLEKRQPELIGLARYLASEASKRPEQQNLKAIELLSLLLIDASGSSIRLAENSALDNQLLGRMKFIVQK